MRNIDYRRKGYGNDKFHGVSGQSRCNVGLRIHFSGSIKSNPKHDKTVEKLRNDGRSRTAQPQHFGTRPVFDEMKKGYVYDLGNQERGNAPDDDPHALPENRNEIGITHTADAGSRDMNGHEQQEKAIGDQSGGDERQSAYAFFAKILVDQIGGDKHNRPRQNPDAHRDAEYVDQLGTNEFCDYSIGDEDAGKDDVEGFFFSLEHGYLADCQM